MFTAQRVAAAAILSLMALSAVGAGGWWILVREDNHLATSAPAIPADLRSTTSVQATPTVVAVGASSVTADRTAFTIMSERSEAAYFADEQLASLPLPSTAKGSTNAITGTIYITSDGLDVDPSRSSTFSVDLTTIESDKSMRDRRVQNEGLEISKYPTAVFTASSVAGYDPSIAAGGEQTLELMGTLDLHGVQKEITWEVKARREGNVITALATVNFQYADFGIPVLNVANFVSVEDDVTLQVQIVAQAA